MFSGTLIYSCENDKTDPVNTFPATRVMSVLIDPSGIVWDGIDDGLINPCVNDIEVVDDGTIWFATDGGISAFNGVIWKIFARE